MGVLDRRDGFRKAGKFNRVVLLELERRALRDAKMNRDLQVEARALGPGAPVIDVVGEALLARVEVDRGDPLASLQQRDRDMHRNR